MSGRRRIGFGEGALEDQPAYMRLRMAFPGLNALWPIFYPRDNRPMDGWSAWMNYSWLVVPCFCFPRGSVLRRGVDIMKTDYC